MPRRAISGLLCTALLLAWPAMATAQSICYDLLDRNTYTGGFNSGDFQSRTDVDVTGGQLILATNEQELSDVNRIATRTRQRLAVHYLYDGSSASHSFGWFFWDTPVSQYTVESGFNLTSQTCTTTNDCDLGLTCEGGYCAYPLFMLRDNGATGGTPNNWVSDWYEVLYTCGGSPCGTNLPDLLQAAASDGGPYPHIPNVLETLTTGGRGGWIFLLTDDDPDTTTYANLAPVADQSSLQNAIPDYDANGDGTIDAADRMVDLGTFDAGVELVFFIVTYNLQTVYGRGVGIDSNASYNSQVVPYFSKRTLNPDNYHICEHPAVAGACPTTSTSCPIFKLGDGSCDPACVNKFGHDSAGGVDDCAFTPSTQNINIGCADGTTCGSPAAPGWLHADTLTMLQNDYGLSLPVENKTVLVRDTKGRVNHVFLGAPSTDPSWWLLGFESAYRSAAPDYNDLAFLVMRTNGGEAVSQNVATEISVPEQPNYTITSVRFRKSDEIPVPPCSANPDEARIDYYISISEDAASQPIWVKVEFPGGSPDEATLDMQAMDLAGAKLLWKAEIISNSHTCKPVIKDVDIGYQALRHGEYLFTTPVTLANAVLRGATETPDQAWTVTAKDRRTRGHYSLYQLYAPDNPENPAPAEQNVEIWDAGDRLAATNPDNRTLFTSQGGARVDLNSATATAWLLGELLSPADRLVQHNGKPVYDLDGDLDCDDDDARRLIEWTRGWETGHSEQRAWKLGAINTSASAVAHVPGIPVWLDKAGIESSHKTSYQSWTQSAQVSTRRSVAYVGSQSGLLHAFDAGNFRWGDNPDTGSVVEQRGYFNYTSGSPDYGTGEEIWAFMPPSLLGFAKNNLRYNYYPELNPPAMVDGSVAVTDIWTGSNWITGIFFSMGRIHPYLSALDVTNPNTPDPLWATDWSDPDFHGTVAAPTLSWMKISGQTQWVLGTSSGLAATPADVFLYLVNATTGQTLASGKIQLNVGSSVTHTDQAYGVAGRAVLVDSAGVGYADRVYVADTNGRVWRYVVGSGADPCLMAAVGQPIYSTPAYVVNESTSGGLPEVAFYFGTGDRPDADDTPSPPYYFHGFVDRSDNNTCALAEQLYQYELPADEKVWADPSIATDRVYFGTATGDKAHICDEDPSNPGQIYVLDLNPDGANQAISLAAPVSAGGSVIGGLIIFDQHALVNTMSGKTTVLGGSTWNNLSGANAATSMKDVYWHEVLSQ